MFRLCRITYLVLLIAIFFIDCNHALAGEGVKDAPPDNYKAIPQLEARAAIVTDQEGNILYRKNERSQMYPASTTKILTALLAVENSELDESVTIGKEITLIPSYTGRCGLQEGEIITMRELIYGLMLRSGNDAAMTIAVNVARKANPDKTLNEQQAVALFAWMMNQRALAIGAGDSHFVNPHGLHDPQHYSTAFDLALITREAMKNSFISQVVATAAYAPASQLYNPGGQPAVWTNTNKLLDENSPFYLPGTIGVKTGHTDESGYCLVSAIGAEQTKIYAVVLNSSQNGVWQDSITLLNYGLSHPTAVKTEPEASPEKKQQPTPSLPKWSYFLIIGIGITVSIVVCAGFSRLQTRNHPRP